MLVALVRYSTGLAFLLTLSVISIVGADAQDKKQPADSAPVLKGKAAQELVLLKLEVDALEKLYHLEMNDKQLSTFLKLAEKTAAKMPATQEVQAGASYGEVLRSLHEALLAQKEERIAELSEKLDELGEKENVSIDDEFEMTDAALAAAPQAFRLLSAAQIVAYLAALDDEVPDPVERILSALEEGAEQTDEEWKELRDETAEEVSWLVGGFRTENAAKAKKAVTALLERGHRYQGEDLKKQLPSLEKAAQQLVGNVSSLVVIEHYLERELAELLSNPRAVPALRLWMQRNKE